MPVISTCYSSPFYLFNGHLQTIVPALIYTGQKPRYLRERLETTDGDFVDLDWVKNGNKKLAIISHGLEGSSSTPYVYRMVNGLCRNNYDVLAWNYRGCSGIPNNKATFYHSGFTADLNEVVAHAAESYSEIILIGFSIGGNITLKYLGEQAGKALPQVKKAVVFSVPCDLESSAIKLARRTHRIYMARFLVSFKHKFKEKNKRFTGYYNLGHFKNIDNFLQFDTIYTAPMYGFKDVHDYYTKASSKQYIPAIKIPTLMVNALNDPFLGDGCFPYDLAEQNPYFYFETPNQGGHVGFPAANGCWTVNRVLKFIDK